MSDEELPSLRCFHLQGGCRAHHNTPGWLRLEPHAVDVSEQRLPNTRYELAISDLQQAGLNVIGADFYTDREQCVGIRLPDWRARLSKTTSGWLCAEQSDLWSHIAYAAVKQANGPLWDVASRISYQLRVCDWRVRQLSEAYYSQLHAIIGSGRFKAGTCLSDGFTWLGYLAFQSFLLDSCVLRDYLAEYRALILDSSIKLTARVSDFAMLKNVYLDKITLALEADKALALAANEDGWLFKLTGYRNLVVHYAPIASAGNDLYTYCYLVRLPSAAELPAIKFPIPSDPRKLILARRSGAYLQDPNQDYARFLNAVKDPQGACDGLEYAQIVLGEMSTLAQLLSEISPVHPRIPHFKFTEGGVIEV